MRGPVWGASGKLGIMPLVLQKAITPAHARAFLTEGYDRVAGYVVRAPEVSHVTDPQELRLLHRTNYDGSPFPPDGPLHILHMDRSPSWLLTPASAMVEYDGDPAARSSLPGLSVEESFLDHTRLTSGARLWRFAEGADPIHVATYRGPGAGWEDHQSGALKLSTPLPTVGAVAVIGRTAYVADVLSSDDGAPIAITALTASEPSTELGFERLPSGVWARAVEHSELSALFEVRVTAFWREHPVLVVQSFRHPEGFLATRIFSLARNWQQARDVGMVEVERGVWELTVKADEIQRITTHEAAARPWMTAVQQQRVAEAAKQQGAASGGTGGEPDAGTLAALKRIATGAMPHIPKEATKVQLLCQSVGAAIEWAAQATMPDGSTQVLSIPEQDVGYAFADLRVLGNKPGAGSWFGALVTLTPAGQVSIAFNRDSQPSMQQPITAQLLRAERERFPRDKWPDWFTALEQGDAG